jgi:ResB-like family protein
MNKTAIQATAPIPTPTHDPPLEEREPSKVWSMIKRILTPLASLRLTVVMFVLAIALVFLGTLAQVDEGIWTVLSKYFRTGIAWIPLQALVRFGQVFLGVSPHAQVSGSFPFPGGWLIGGVLLVNLLAAHAVRFKLTWKRSGILMIHSGLVLMMLGELITGLFALEGRMPIPEGWTVNFVEDHRALELAVIRHLDDKTDDVVAIPASMLRKKGRIKHPDLPFDVEVLQYMPNSDVNRNPPPGMDNPATAGDGLREIAVEKPEVSGTDQGQTDDMPSAYVKLWKPGTNESLGTFLVSKWWSVWWIPGLEQPQHITVDGKTYDLFLRSKRAYKPYSFHLIEFRHDRYMGTDTPKNYSSQVHLTDAARGDDEEVVIYMNHPLRHAGETFYQTGVLGSDQGTILQVVRNPGWLLPYVSCALVALGMLFHFPLHLIQFLARRMKA